MRACGIICSSACAPTPGLTGVGEATLEWQEQTVQTLLHEWVEGRVLGRDPFDIEAVVGGMIRDQYQGGSTVMTAISGVEIALWDLIGKACGQPVYRLLGRPVPRRDSRPMPTAGTAGRARRPSTPSGPATAVARGYRGAQVRPVRHGLEGCSTARQAEAAVDIVAAVREAVGAGRRADDRVPRPALRRRRRRDDPPARAVPTRPGARSRSRRSASSCWPRSSGRPAARSPRASGSTPRPTSTG